MVVITLDLERQSVTKYDPGNMSNMTVSPCLRYTIERAEIELNPTKFVGVFMSILKFRVSHMETAGLSVASLA